MKVKKVSGWKMKKDWKGSWQPMMKRLFGFWRRMTRSLQGKCLGETLDSRREKGKKNREAKRAVTNEVASNPFEKVAPAKANMANENQDRCDPAYGGKGEGRKGKKVKSKFQYPYDGNSGYPSYGSGKEKSGRDKGKSKTFAATAENLEEQSANQQIAPSTEPAYASWTDQDWDPSWNWSESGWYSSHETSSTGQALIAFYDAFQSYEKEVIHEKLIQDDTVSEHNLFVTTKQSLLATKLVAPVINPQHNLTYATLDNGCTRSMGSWHALQRFTQAIKPMKDLISYPHMPAETNSRLPIKGQLDLVSQISHDSSSQYQHRHPVPILPSISQMRCWQHSQGGSKPCLAHI